jgi:hypothetical protein
MSLLGVHAEVAIRVDQELPFTNPVTDEKAACSGGADICAAIDVHCLSFLAGGRRRAEYTFALRLRNGDGTSRGWM